MTLALGAINWIVGRDFLFFARLFKIVTSYVADSSHLKPWWNPWQSGWYWKARYLGPLAAGLVIAVAAQASILKPRGPLSPREQHILVFATAYTFSSLLWLMWQTLGHTALDWDYFAYPLVYPLTAAVAAAADRWLKFPPGEGPGVLWRILIVGLFLAPLYFFNTSFVLSAFALHGSFLPALAMIGIALACLILFGKHYLGGLVFVGLMSLGLVLGLSGAGGVTRDSCPSARLAADAIDQAHRLLRMQGYSYSRIFIWADQDETVPAGTGCAVSSANIRLGHFSSALVATGFQYVQPAWEAAQQDQLKESRLAELSAVGGLIVYVTNEEARVQQLMERFLASGGSLKVKGREVVTSRSLRVPMNLLEIKNKTQGE
ncbi:hypothetical protein [Microvirga brassicacearum]|uniref:Uncharacterized protein n=1 Tax=Microvirga brassicacearum TaxID=2580413 RepID=A0A5N3PJA1_9HYPH|nr:hypothetical protein [Microvirga brassicacearum]KAB0269705.1 hypothetical protein FEZ63_00060 [Microvirga brassicacearum]